MFVLRVIVTAMLVWQGSASLVDDGRWFWSWALEHSTASSRELRVLRFEATSKLAKPGDFDLVGFGTSIVAHDLDVALLQTQLPVAPDRMAMLAAAGYTEFELAMLVKRLIAIRPRVVVHPVIVWTLYDPAVPPEWRGYDAEAAVAIRGFDILGPERGFHMSGFLAASHPVFRHREAIRILLLNPAKAMLAEIEPVDVQLDRDIAERMAYREDANAHEFRCDGTQAHALIWLAEKLRQADIELVTAMAPIYDRWGANAEVVARLDRCFQVVAGQVGHLHLSHRQLGDYRHEDFFDHMHLNPQGGQRFTEALLPTLRKALARTTP